MSVSGAIRRAGAQTATVRPRDAGSRGTAHGAPSSSLSTPRRSGRNGDGMTGGLDHDLVWTAVNGQPLWQS